MAISMLIAYIIYCSHSNPKEGNAEECSNYHTTLFISYASKVMLKILQARLQQFVDQELPNVQAGFKKGRGTRGQIANIRWIIEKAREFQKTTYFCFTDYAKAFDCVWLFAAPWTVVHQAFLYMEFSGKKTGVGRHSLFQGIFPTLLSNLGLLHYRRIFYQLSHKRSPRILK